MFSYCRTLKVPVSSHLLPVLVVHDWVPLFICLKFLHTPTAPAWAPPPRARRARQRSGARVSARQLDRVGHVRRREPCDAHAARVRSGKESWSELGPTVCPSRFGLRLGHSEYAARGVRYGERRHLQDAHLVKCTNERSHHPLVPWPHLDRDCTAQ